MLWDLYSVIQESDGKKTKALEFDEFPYNNPDKVLDIIIKFAQEANKQTQVNPSILSLESLSNKIASYDVEFNVNLPTHFSMKDVYDGIINQKPYLYYVDDIGTRTVVDRLGLGEQIFIGKTNKKNIYVNDELLFSEISIIQDKDGSLCKIGNHIRIKMVDDKKLLISYEIKGYLSERISTIKFLLGIIQNSVKFDDYKLPVNSNNNPYIDVDNLSNRLNYYLDIRRTFDKIGVYKDLDYDALTVEQSRNLYYFVKSELYGEEFAWDVEAGEFAFLRLPNINILCHCLKSSNNDKKHVLHSIFDDNLLKLVVEKDDVYVPVSKYYYLLSEEDENGFEYVDNVNFDDLYNDLKLHLIDEVNASITNMILLKLLSFYDKTLFRLVLESCEKIANLLCLFSNNDKIYTLNLLQIKCRIRELTKEEKKLILDMKEKTSDMAIKWACSVLLKSKEEADLLFDSMNDDVQEELRGFPIYNLYAKI